MEGDSMVVGKDRLTDVEHQLNANCPSKQWFFYVYSRTTHKCPNLVKFKAPVSFFSLDSFMFNNLRAVTPPIGLESCNQNPAKCPDVQTAKIGSALMNRQDERPEYPSSLR